MDDDVFEALRCCISTKKCTECPRWNTCGQVDFRQDNITISKVLALDVINKLKAMQEEIEKRTAEATAYAELLIKYGHEFT